jgi:hypothetical protein
LLVGMGNDAEDLLGKLTALLQKNIVSGLETTRNGGNQERIHRPYPFPTCPESFFAEQSMGPSC